MKNRRALQCSRVRTIAAVTVAVSTLAAIGAIYAPGIAGATTATGASALNCAVPALPHGVKNSSSTSQRLSGPAVTALKGGEARHGFSLDHGGLVVTPPRRGDIPLLTADEAICGAMNSTGALSGSLTDGVAVGYGRVSVAKRFFPAYSGFPSPGETPAQFPIVRSFDNRLAWLVVVHNFPASFSCPAEIAPTHRRTALTQQHPAEQTNDHGYEVFMLDAQTGADALVYKEGGLGGCTGEARIPPSVFVAEQSVSVPWTLTSRDPNGYSGTISATVLACDQVPDSVLVDREGPNVEVRVTRPFGPPCSPPQTAQIKLDAAVVTADLPAEIGHDPVGLTNLLSLDFSAPPGSPTTTTTTSPPLVNVDESNNGQTLQLTVGEVVTVPPFPGSQGGPGLVNPAVSTDPAVLGPLTSGPQPAVAEFRAWKPGTAQITVPESACVHPGSALPPCNGAFVVTVVVH